MKKCRIIQDLLPNYTEELTGSITNYYLQKHIKKCKKCKNELRKFKIEDEIKEQYMKSKQEVRKLKKECNIKEKSIKCEIVYDLLPDFIECVTSETTDRYMIKHLKHCSKCKKVFKDMFTRLY